MMMSMQIQARFFVLAPFLLSAFLPACATPGGARGRIVPPGLDPRASDDEKPLFQVLIRPDNDASGMWEWRLECDWCFAAAGISLREAIGRAYGSNDVRVVGSSSALDKRYTIVIVPPRGQKNLFYTLFRNALEVTFGIAVSRETREMDAYVLSAPDGAASVLYPPNPEEISYTRDGEAVMQQVPLSAAFYSLEEQLNAYIVDETNLKGEYSFRLEWNAGEPQSIVQAVKDQLGLSLAPSRRPVEVLVVEKR